MVHLVMFWACWLCAGVANSFTDWFGFDQQSDDWRNKYAKPLKTAPQSLYYKLTGLPFRERFLLSGTILCFLTDRFHFCQAIQTTCLIGSMCLAVYGVPWTWWFPIELILTWGLTTHTSYIFVRRYYLSKPKTSEE